MQSGASSGIFNFAFNGVVDTYKYSSGQITGEELKEKTKYNVVESASQAVLVGGIAALAGPATITATGISVVASVANSMFWKNYFE